MTQTEITSAIPHRPPFLFVDKILQWEENRIVCQYTFKEDEFFFKGHYPGSPIVPGVILCESAMQCGAILLSRIFRSSESGPAKIPVVARMGDVRFKNPVFPTDTLTVEVDFKERMGNAYFMSAKLTNQEKIVLRFDFSCTATDRPATQS